MTDSKHPAAITEENDALPAKGSVGARPARVDWRLHRHADYQHVYQGSRKQFVPLMAFFVKLRDAEAPTAHARVGLTAGRVLGKAVQRNRIKRRMRAAVREHFSLLPERVDVILHPRRNVLEAPYAGISADVERVFRKVKTFAQAARNVSTVEPGA